jgi:pyruvate dehydrogenase E2 component (dihydrolipoamide acetyltransferase)
MPEGGELMAEEFFIPKLGQTVEEVTLVKWLVSDGDKVAQGQEICEVETDKAIFPVEANAKGYFHMGPFKEGEVLPVLTVVGIIGKETDKFEAGEGKIVGEPASGEQGSASLIQEVTAAATSASAAPAEVFASPRARKLASEKGVDLSQVAPTGYDGVRAVERDVVAYLASAPMTAAPMAAEPKVTPVAQKVAAAAGVDLRAVTGTGPGGKIVKEDVLRAAEKPTPAVALPAAVSALPSVAAPEVIERIPLKGVRGIIAERMGSSVHTTARVTLLMDVDATELVAVRERLKAKVSEDWGFAPAYNDLLAKIVAAALGKFPYMNARLASDGEAIELLGRINIGQAVDTERGLLVPVIRDANLKSLRQLGMEFREQAERARKGRSLLEELSGGTFTITNLGMYEVDAFTPVINLPEVAILGVGRIAPWVVPYHGEVAVRSMMTLSLVFDHRLVDGAPAARFLQYIKHVIEEPYLLLAG